MFAWLAHAQAFASSKSTMVVGAALLQSLGCPGDAAQLAAIATWLQQQEVDNLSELEGVPGIGNLPGSLFVSRSLLAFHTLIGRCRYTSPGRLELLARGEPRQTFKSYTY